CRQEERRLQAEPRHEAADGWPGDEANAADGRESAKELAALLWLGDISDIGEQDAEIATCQAVDDAPQEEDPQCAAKAKEQVADSRAKQADDQDWTTAKAIAERAQTWGSNELADGIAGGQPAHHRRQVARIAQVLLHDE